MLQETIDCTLCLSDIVSPECDAAIFDLINNQNRGSLLYPTIKFINVICIILDFSEKVIPFLGTNGIVKNLYQFIYPKLKNCPIWKCSLNSHVETICSIICGKFLPIIFKNIAKNQTDMANNHYPSLFRKYLKFK